MDECKPLGSTHGDAAASEVHGAPSAGRAGLVSAGGAAPAPGARIVPPTPGRGDGGGSAGSGHGAGQVHGYVGAEWTGCERDVSVVVATLSVLADGPAGAAKPHIQEGAHLTWTILTLKASWLLSGQALTDAAFQSRLQRNKNRIRTL